MAFTAWGYSRQLSGSGVKLETFQAGTGGWTKGAPLVVSSGKLVVKTAGTSDTVPIKYVAAETIASGSYGMAYPALPDTVFQVKVGGGTAAVGVQCSLVATDMTLDVSAVTVKSIEVVGINPADTTLAYVVSRGWLS